MTLERDYGFDFTDDGTPADGVEAKDISITLVYEKARKETRMSTTRARANTPSTSTARS